MLKTAAFVTVVSVFERFLGFLYRIILSRKLGAEGVGIYQIALSVFAVLVTLVCSGIPITVSRLIAKYRAENNQKAKSGTVSAAIVLSVALSLPISAVLFFGHKHFDFLFSDPRCMEILIILLPCLVCSSVYSVIRGIFWGNKDFVPYSLVEMVEELIMVIVGILLVRNISSVFDGAKRAAIAMLIAYISSFVLAVIVFAAKKEKLSNPKGYIKPLFLAAAPITGMRTISSSINSLVAIILPMRLIASGLSSADALAAFGVSFGMAIPVLYIPSTLIGSLSVVLVPELAENYYKHQSATLKRNIEKALKFAVIIACVCAPVLFVIGKDIGLLIYNNLDSGVFISRISVIMIPLSITMITSSMLNSLGCEKNTLIYFCFGAAAMLLCVWFLPKYIGAYALAAGMLASHTITAVLNLRQLTKKSRVSLKYKRFLCLSILFALPSIVIGSFVYTLLSVYCGYVITAAVTAVVMLGVSVCLYTVFDMLDFKGFLAPFFRNRHRRS